MASNQEAQAQCPTCSAVIPLDAKECPKCGEVFAEEPRETPKAPVATPEPTEEVVKTGRMEKIMFYISIILILLGGPGLAFGSWLHDILRIPIVGSTYDAFGDVNKLFASVGLIILIIGILMLIFSLRRTTVVVEEYDLSFEGKEESERTAGK